MVCLGHELCGLHFVCCCALSRTFHTWSDVESPCCQSDGETRTNIMLTPEAQNCFRKALSAFPCIANTWDQVLGPILNVAGTSARPLIFPEQSHPAAEAVKDSWGHEPHMERDISWSVWQMGQLASHPYLSRGVEGAWVGRTGSLAGWGSVGLVPFDELDTPGCRFHHRGGTCWHPVVIPLWMAHHIQSWEIPH